MIGKIFSHYRIIEKLGEGGMGVVYKAMDIKLNRPVALKFITSGYLPTEEKKVQLLLEAQAAASVNHPNVCTVYEVDGIMNDIGEEQLFMAMEFIEGQNLKDIIKKRNITEKKAVDIAIQIAEGLKEIHEKGLVHRDIKSDNIRLTKSRQVKIMDFGLVKSPKIKDTLKREFSTGGTIAYMSPEQIRGNEVDHRSDIWSWGIVLYEMLTGYLPFESKDKSITMVYSILDEPPRPVNDYCPELSPVCARILDRALEKERENRYQSMLELISDLLLLKEQLHNSFSETENKEHKHVSPGLTKKVVWSIAAGIILIIAAGIIWVFHMLKSRSEPRVSILTSYLGEENYPSLSPHGNKLLFEYGWDICLKLIGEDEHHNITSTNGIHEYSPVWSPDGNNIAYIRTYADQSGIFMKPLLGGREIMLHSYPGHDLSVFNVDIWPEIDWSWDGEWLVFNDLDTLKKKHCLFRLNMVTRETEQLTFPGENYQGDMNARFSPDGKALVFQRVYSYDLSDLFLLDLKSGHLNQLTDDRKTIRGLTWIPDGTKIIFSSNRDGVFHLWSISIHGNKLKSIPFGGQSVSQISVSRTGNCLAYTSQIRRTNIYEAKLPKTFHDRIKLNKLIASNQGEYFGSYSPDGEKIVFGSDRSGSAEIWLCKSDGSNPVQITNRKVHTNMPRWSPDGKQLAIESDGNILIMDSEGAKPPHTLVSGPSDNRLPTWSHDGKWIYFGSDRNGKFEVYRVQIQTGDMQQITRGNAFFGFESPDGKYFFFESRLQDSMIYRIDLESMEESVVINESTWVNWRTGVTGIYYLVYNAKSDRLLKKYNYASEKTELLGILEKDPEETVMNLSDVSPDEQYILLWGAEKSADIYLVKNIRL